MRRQRKAGGGRGKCRALWEERNSSGFSSPPPEEAPINHNTNQSSPQRETVQKAALISISKGRRTKKYRKRVSHAAFPSMIFKLHLVLKDLN